MKNQKPNNVIITLGLALLYLLAVESAAKAHHHEFVLVDNFNCSAYHFSQTNSAPDSAAFENDYFKFIEQPEFIIEEIGRVNKGVLVLPHLSPRSPPVS